MEESAEMTVEDYQEYFSSLNETSDRAADYSNSATQNMFNAKDPIWVDDVWLDTVVVVGLTCFILCLMGLSKVSKSTF
jgi:hypothetical protein